ncbi:unnamed protein product, partial [Larinioides sclopetarius]
MDRTRCPIKKFNKRKTDRKSCGKQAKIKEIVGVVSKNRSGNSTGERKRMTYTANFNSQVARIRDASYYIFIDILLI